MHLITRSYTADAPKGLRAGVGEAGRWDTISNSPFPVFFFSLTDVLEKSSEKLTALCEVVKSYPAKSELSVLGC